MHASVLEWLEESSVTYADKLALCDEWESYTYKEYHDKAVGIADAVIATGLEDDTLPTNKPVSPYGTFANKYVKPVTPNISLKPTGVNPSGEVKLMGVNSAGMTQAPRKTATGITNPGDIRSNVTNKPLNIPDFLQKK